MNGTASGAAIARHTPFDGSAPAFTIGLRPLDLADWIEPDERFSDQLLEKTRLAESAPAAVFRAEAGSQATQGEVLRLLTDHLAARFPDLYTVGGETVRIHPTDQSFAFADWHHAPLQLAGRLVQEDLCLMAPGADGWRLTAASLSFPSLWSLADKLGRPMAAIHAQVPGFAGQMNTRVGRIFDNLGAERPVWRLNWSIHDEATLFLPPPRTRPRFQDFLGDPSPAHVFLRTERQTLRKLPESGDILFTIKTRVDPLPVLARLPDRDRILGGLIASIEALSADQLAYKGLTAARNTLLDVLRDLRSTSGASDGRTG